MHHALLFLLLRCGDFPLAHRSKASVVNIFHARHGREHDSLFAFQTSKKVPLCSRDFPSSKILATELSILSPFPSARLIPLANPEAPDDKEREKQEKEEHQVKDRRKENIDVTETASSLSSASRNRPSRTSSLPEGE
jgi:hypothetical protein